MNREGFGGYGDWRLPTREELASLLRYAKAQGFDAHRMDTWPYVQLAHAGFSNVRDYGYWSSTRDERDRRNIWVADMTTGEMVPRVETTPTACGRCAAAGSPSDVTPRAAVLTALRRQV